MRRSFSPILLLAVFIVPLAVSLWGAFAGPSSDGLAHLMQTVLPGYGLTTFGVMVFAAGLSLALGTATAFAVTFFDLPFRSAIDTALVLPLALPPYLVAIVYRQVLGAPLQSAFGLSVVLAITSYPYVYLLARLAFRRQSAVYLETAACLGVGRTTVIRRVVLPLAIPALALGGALVAVESVSDFGAADVLSVDTMTGAVRRTLFSAFDERLALQVALLSAVLPLVVAGVYAWLVHGRSFAASSNRPRPPDREALGLAPGAAAAALCLVPPLAGFVIPLAVLLQWASRAFAKLDLSDVAVNAANTILLSGLAAVVAVLLGLWITLQVRWQGGAGLRIASVGVVALNLALPSVVIGVAMLVLTGWGMGLPWVRWVSDTILVLCAALVFKYTAFAFFTTESAFATISPRMDEAGLAAGRTPGYVQRRVLIPLSVDGAVIGATLVFLLVAKELTLSLTLHPFGFMSLSMSAYHLAKVDAHAQAAVYALILAAVCLYPVLSLHRWVLR